MGGVDLVEFCCTLHWKGNTAVGELRNSLPGLAPSGQRAKQAEKRVVKSELANDTADKRLCIPVLIDRMLMRMKQKQKQHQMRILSWQPTT